MEENSDIKVPTTRRNQRLSVDLEIVSSPATPTKKKPARVTARPILDNIKEDSISGKQEMKSKPEKGTLIKSKSKDRMQKFRRKLKENKEKYIEHLEKERERDKKRYDNMKSNQEGLLRERKKKVTINRMQKYRNKLKGNEEEYLKHLEKERERDRKRYAMKSKSKSPVVSSPKPTRRRSTAKDLDDDKPVTPSRRSTRIRSNTSLVLETALQSVVADSPRAKRAARRNSLAGSDSEAPSTPVKTTRRIRKDSTSSIENNDPVVSKPVIEETIAEEPENQIESLSPNNSLPTRKSPRLATASSKKSGDFSTVDNNAKVTPKRSSTSKLNNSNGLTPSKSNDDNDKKDNEEGGKESELNKLYVQLPKLEISPVTSTNEYFQAQLNKIRDTSKKQKAKLSKSWTTISNDRVESKKINRSLNITDGMNGTGDFFGKDDKPEASIELLQDAAPQNIKCEVYFEDSSSNGDAKKNEDSNDNYSDNISLEVNFINQEQPNVSDETNKSKQGFFEEKNKGENISCEPMDIDETLKSQADADDSHKQDLKETTLNISEAKTNISLNKSKNRKCSLSKSSTDSIDLLVTEEKDTVNEESQDEPRLNESKSKKNSSSSSIQELKQNKNETGSFKVGDDTNFGEYTDNKTFNNAKSNISLDETDSNVSINKRTTRKSFLSNSKASEKTEIENKRTFILSKVNDSANENSMNKSQKMPLNTSSMLVGDKKQNLSDIQDNTPLRNKHVKGLGLQTSTPVVVGQKGSKSKKPEVSEINETCSSGTGIDDSDDGSNADSSKDGIVKSMFLDDEAEDAGDDYQSGDSVEEEEVSENESDEEEVSGNESEDEEVSESESEDEENSKNESEDEGHTENESENEKRNENKPDDEEHSESKNISLNPISRVQVDENVSIPRIENATSDPLQEDNDDSASLSSENPEISQKFDAVLESLNKSNNKDIKQNRSLNLDKKSKPKENILIDQLNLSKTKKPIQKNKGQNNSKVEVLKEPAVNKDSDSSSLDIHLLYSDSSSNDGMIPKKDSQDYIPLKRSFGTTNLHNEHETVFTDDINKKELHNVTPKILESHTDKEDNNDKVTKSSKKNKRLSESTLPPPSEETGEKKKQQEHETATTVIEKRKKRKRISEPQEDLENKNSTNETTVLTDDTDKEEHHNVNSKTLDTSAGRVGIEGNTYNVTKSSKKNKTLAESSLPPPSQEKGKEKMQHAVDQEYATVPPVIEKRKKRKRISEPQEEIENINEKGKEKMQHAVDQEHATVPTIIEKRKKRKRISEPQEEIENINETTVLTDDTDKEEHHNVNSKTLDTSAGRVGLEGNTYNITKSSKKNKTLAESSLPPPSQEKGKEKMQHAVDQEHATVPTVIEKRKKRKRISEPQEEIENINNQTTSEEKVVTKTLKPNSSLNGEPQLKKSKRKATEDIDIENNIKKTKILKKNQLDNIHIPRLAPAVLQQLEGPNKKRSVAVKKSNVVACGGNFVIEETVKHKIKPSQYLEQSIHLDSDSPDKKNRKKNSFQLPKVLPFVPTAVTSSHGFTTRFQISVLPKEIKFTAQTSNSKNFKNDYLFGKNIKRMGTYDLYKKNRNNKLSKF